MLLVLTSLYPVLNQGGQGPGPPTGYNVASSGAGQPGLPATWKTPAQLGVDEFCYNDPLLTANLIQQAVPHRELQILDQEVQIAQGTVFFGAAKAYLPFISLR
jgi:hypothetical protein